MGVALKGNSLVRRRNATEAAVKKTMNAELMNYLSLINHVIEKNKGKFVLKSWLV